MNYQLFRPPTMQPFSAMTLREARRYSQWFMSEIPKRFIVLQDAVSSFDEEEYKLWKASKEPKSLEILGKWFASNIETRPITEAETLAIQASLKQGPPEFHNELTPTWKFNLQTLSLVIDIGIYLGEVFVANHPTLHWVMVDKGKKHFKHNIISGFQNKLVVDPFHLARSVGLGVYLYSEHGDQLLKYYEHWSSLTHR